MSCTCLQCNAMQSHDFLYNRMTFLSPTNLECIFKNEADIAHQSCDTSKWSLQGILAFHTKTVCGKYKKMKDHLIFLIIVIILLHNGAWHNSTKTGTCLFVSSCSLFCICTLSASVCMVCKMTVRCTHSLANPLLL